MIRVRHLSTVQAQLLPPPLNRTTTDPQRGRRILALERQQHIQVLPCPVKPRVPWLQPWLLQRPVT